MQLVVADEEIIHVMVGETLKDQQLEVIGVTSGEEALKSYQDANGAVKAVSLDMSLPGMYGLSTVQKLRDLDPQVNAIVSSGDPHQREVCDVMAAGALGMLANPFSPAHLQKVVEQVFGQRQTGLLYPPTRSFPLV